jgi:hypothetical protein
MAIDIAYKASVDIGDGAKSLKSLKQEFKETQKELDGLTIGSQKYVDTLRKLGDVKDQIADLNEEIAAFDGGGKIKALGNVVQGVASGFQGAVGAAALFGGESEDLQKTLVKLQAVMAFKEGLQGIEGLGQSFKAFGQALKTNPLFLVVTILTAIGTAMFALKDKVSFIGDAFDALGKVISTVVQAGKDFLDFLGATDFASKKLSDSIISNAERIKNANTSRYDSEIAAAKRAGEVTELLEIKKAADFKKANEIIINQLKLRQKAGDTLSQEETKQLKDLLLENAKASEQQVDLLDKYNDDKAAKDKAAYEKRLDENKKGYSKELEAKQKAEDEILRLENEAALKVKAELEQEFKDKQEADAYQTEQAKLAFNAASAAIDKRKADKDLEAAQDRQRIQDTLAIAKNSNDALQGLSDLFFSIKMANTKKGSKEEEEAAKKQFKINKALQLSNALITGVSSILAITSVPDFTLGIATAVRIGAQVALNAASIAKIAAVQYNAGGGGGGGSMPAISAPTVGTTPTINAPSQSTTSLNPDGSVRSTNTTPTSIKAYVVETEITGTQNQVSQIENLAKHG